MYEDRAPRDLRREYLLFDEEDLRRWAVSQYLDVLQEGSIGPLEAKVRDAVEEHAVTTLRARYSRSELYVYGLCRGYFPKDIEGRTIAQIAGPSRHRQRNLAKVTKTLRSAIMLWFWAYDKVNWKKLNRTVKH
jgi:hypothetical protein